MKKRVVVIGGGFSGSTVARELEDDFDVTLIDSKDYFEYTPGILRVLQHPIVLERIRRKHADYLRRAKIVKGSVKEVSMQHVLVNDKKIEYDYLAICSGASCRSMSGTIGAYRAADLLEVVSKVKKAKKIVVIGGGLVGLELVGELCDMELGKKTVLIHSRSNVIHRNDKKAVVYAKKFLEDNGVKVLYGSKVKKVSKGTLETDKGKKVKADIIFNGVGIKSNFDFMKKFFSSAVEKGVKVNDYLQVKGQENIFAAGDVTSVKEEKTAQAAGLAGEIIAHNIMALEFGRPFRKYSTKKRPMLISLGKKVGILDWNGFVLTGKIPAVMKDYVERKEMKKVS